MPVVPPVTTSNESLLAQFFDESTRLFPSFRAFLGDHSYDDQYENTLSKSHSVRYKRLVKRYQALLSSVKTQSDIDTIILSWILRDSVEGFKHPLHLIPIDSYDNMVINFTFINKQMYPLACEDDIKHLIMRHIAFIKVVDDIIHNMRRGMRRKFVLPKLICTRLISSLENFLKTKAYAFHLPPALSEYQHGLDAFFHVKYRPVIRTLIVFLQEEYLPVCRETFGLCYVPGGKNIYKYCVRSQTTLDDMSPEEAHQLGVEEVKRLVQELHKVKETLGYSSDMDLQDFYKAMMNDRQYLYTSEKHILKDYKSVARWIDAHVIPPNFKCNVENHDIVTVPKSMESTAPGAFYYPPSVLSKNRPGTFYLNVRDLREHVSYTTLALSLHEGKPGHHYQFQYMKEKGIPLHRMYGISGTSFVEGWGLYAESLANYTDKPAEYFGKLTYEIFRAVRLVVDTGIHYYGWTYEKALSYMKEHVAMTESELKTEVERYICMPAQALCYKIGELRLQAWKRQWLKHFGNTQKSVQAFHECVLESGIIPLDVLGKKVQRCMHSNKPII